MPAHDSLQFVGVDAAKLDLAIQFPGQPWSTGNTARGHAAFLAWLWALGPVHVIREATGAYERALVTVLHQVGIAFSKILTLALLSEHRGWRLVGPLCDNVYMSFRKLIILEVPQYTARIVYCVQSGANT